MRKLRCLGAGRDAENNRVLWFHFDRPPTDNELRFLHDCMSRAALLANDDSKSFLRLVPKQEG